MTTNPTDQNMNISFNRGYWEGFREDDPEQIDLRVRKKIEVGSQLARRNGMVPSVFKARQLNGKLHIGCNYQPEGTALGDRFHYDHGVGIQRNQDAEVIWLKPKA